MQVHGDDTINTGYGKQVGYQFGTNADTGLVFAILTCPSEIGDNGIDGACRGALGSIDHQQQLHQVVTIGECALYEEDIATANRLLERDSKLAVGELCDLQFTERTS